MSDHIDNNEILPLLATLKEAVRDFVGREEVLVRDHWNECLRQNKAFETASTRLSSQLATSVAESGTLIQTEKAKLQSQLNKRIEAIHRAQRTSLKQALQRVDEFEGQGKYHLQKSVLDNDRQRDARLAGADAALEDFKGKLAEHGAALSASRTAAQTAFQSYGKFRRLLSPSATWPDPALSGDEHDLLVELEKAQTSIREDLRRFRGTLPLCIFAWLPLWLIVAILLLGTAMAAFLLPQFGVAAISQTNAGGVLVVSLSLLAAAYLYGRYHGRPLATSIAKALAKTSVIHGVSLQKSELRHKLEHQRIHAETEAIKQSLDEQWRNTVQQAAEKRVLLPKEMEEKASRIARKSEAFFQEKAARLERQQRETIDRLSQEARDRQQHIRGAHEAKMSKINEEHHIRIRALQEDWKARIQPMWDAIQRANTAAKEEFPEWQHRGWEKWVPPKEFKNAARFGRIDVDLLRLTEVARVDRPMGLPFPAAFSIPLILAYPGRGSILFETFKMGVEPAVAAMNSILFRLLASIPPGKLCFTLIDPVGLGQSFAGLMHLADYAESFVNGHIWTQSNQIEEKLGELCEHMEKVIQMYLRNEYATIADYNAQAGVIAEKYHVLVAAGFPVNFSESAGRRLLNIASSGARCGVYTVIHWDHRHVLPHDFTPDELRKNSVCVTETDSGFVLDGQRLPGVNLVLDAPPSPDWATRFLRQVGGCGRDANRVEVPFERVAPTESELWTKEASEELVVPIGRSGATKQQLLAIGKGTRQHALIVGKTGSGKSTLFHVIITNLALWCSPEQVEFYLVDFKKGVEFKCYATRRLPHARVVAIESDRQFGLSVLQRVDEELKRRGELFRALGIQDLTSYKKAGGTEPLPRCLLIIDEFQEFFVEEDRISQNAAVLLDRIVRQGRAFGIHVLLGSQTLGGAYTLARATLGQMVIRIALQCNEADAYLIMDESNSAPRLLSRPGEGIYNDAAGAIEGNSPFQTVWLSDATRDGLLAQIRARANLCPKPLLGPLVFEGNAPADIKENAELWAVLRTKAVKSPLTPRIWIGAPNSIKGPTEAVFKRQSGHNLVVVGQREEAALSILSAAMVSLAAQFPKGAVRFILFDGSPPGSRLRNYADTISQVLPQSLLRPKQTELADILKGLSEELKQSHDQEGETMTTFLLFHGLQSFRKLRREDEFNFTNGDSNTLDPGALLLNLIVEGPSCGLHTLITCDTYNNILRFLGRKALGEIALRVLFQMSASDSASLIDSPDAGNLGLHRALLYNEQEGYIETFRPYALPGNDWIDEVNRLLNKQVQR